MSKGWIYDGSTNTRTMHRLILTLSVFLLNHLIVFLLNSEPAPEANRLPGSVEIGNVPNALQGLTFDEFEEHLLLVQSKHTMPTLMPTHLWDACGLGFIQYM